MKKLLFLSLLASSLFLISGCDQSPVQDTADPEEEPPETQKAVPFHVTSGEHLAPKASEARQLRAFLSTSEVAAENVDFNKLSIIKMNVKGYEKEVSAVVAPLRRESSSSIRIPSERNDRKYSVNHSQLIYLPSLEESVTVDWHLTGKSSSGKWSGFAQFDTPNMDFVYEVENGVPVDKVYQDSSPEGVPVTKDDCLSGPDCSTSECYATATDACEGDPDCDLACDLVDTFGGGACTVSIAAACLYVNTF